MSELDSHVIAYEGKTIYDFDNEIVLNWYARRVSNLSNGSLLELGLGHGYAAKIFSNHFDSHVILEGSPAVIDNFKKRFPSCNVDIVETLFENYKSSKKFDVIVMGFVLEHVENPLFILDYYRELLMPTGKLFIAVPNAEAMNRRLGYYAGLLDDMDQLSQNDFDLGHKRLYTIERLKSEVVSAGYKLVRLEGIYLKPFTTSQIISLNLDRKIIEGMCDLGISYPELSCGLLAEVTNE
jgi:2-polyprenyl-3-methyl-5-hydroxy-6-metoxy-1,4-benzoquinol methylase